MPLAARGLAELLDQHHFQGGGRPTKVQASNDTLELDGPLARKFNPLEMALRGRNSEILAVALRLSDLSPFAREKDTRFGAATFCGLRTVAGHENRPALRGALVLKTEMGGPARTSLIAPSLMGQTARAKHASAHSPRLTTKLRKNGPKTGNEVKSSPWRAGVCLAKRCNMRAAWGSPQTQLQRKRR